MISPLPSASLLSLPLDNLPPTPPPTHSSASTSPLDCGRQEDTTSHGVDDCRPTSASPPTNDSIGYQKETSEDITASCSNSSSEVTHFVETHQSAKSAFIFSSKTPMPKENGQETSTVTVNITPNSPLKLDSSSLVVAPSKTCIASSFVENESVNMLSANCEHDGAKSMQLKDSSIMAETLSKFLLAIVPVQNASNDRPLDWNGRKSRVPLECSPPADAERAQEASPISSRVARKLKIYTMEEKLDIVDFATVIGNRAAGREYGVAESSIREWRKNEKKYRQNVAANADKTRIECVYPWVMKEIDARLLLFIDERKDQGVDWYDIRDHAQSIWLDIIKSGRLANANYTSTAISFTMGWVSRFMNRNTGLVSNIPKPVVATNTALNSSSNILQNFSEPKGRNGDSVPATRPVDKRVISSSTLKRQCSRCEIEPDAGSLPKRTKKSKHDLTPDVSASPSDFSTKAAQRISGTVYADGQAASASSRRKSHQPRRLTPENETAASTCESDKNRESSAIRSHNNKIANRRESSSIFCNNNDMLSAIAKLWTNSSGKNEASAASYQKQPADFNISQSSSPNSTGIKQSAHNQLQQPYEQQNYQQQMYRHLTQLITSLSEANGINGRTVPATAGIPPATHNGATFLPLALNANALAAVQLIQNMPCFATKDDMKISK